MIAISEWSKSVVESLGLEASAEVTGAAGGSAQLADLLTSSRVGEVNSGTSETTADLIRRSASPAHAEGSAERQRATATSAREAATRDDGELEIATSDEEDAMTEGNSDFDEVGDSAGPTSPAGGEDGRRRADLPHPRAPTPAQRSRSAILGRQTRSVLLDAPGASVHLRQLYSGISTAFMIGFWAYLQREGQSLLASQCPFRVRASSFSVASQAPTRTIKQLVIQRDHLLGSSLRALRDVGRHHSVSVVFAREEGTGEGVTRGWFHVLGLRLLKPIDEAYETTTKLREFLFATGHSPSQPALFYEPGAAGYCTPAFSALLDRFPRR